MFFVGKMAGKLRTKKRSLIEDFPVVNDEKLRLSLMSQADRWNDYARSIIYETYNDTKLLLLYKQARDTRAFQSGWKDKSHREVVRFPNGFVYNFCKAVLEPMYGPDWAINHKAWRHELIRPWLLINI